MTTRYRVEYALKSHRRDQFIEWVKGMLISPFVLFSQPAGDFEAVDAVFAADSAEVRRRYAEIMRDIEHMIDEHRALQGVNHLRGEADSVGGLDPASTVRPSRLQLLVPTVGPFFTPLPLEAAFLHTDEWRRISSRRLVAPSFNDIRLTLNTAQMMALTGRGRVRPSSESRLSGSKKSNETKSSDSEDKSETSESEEKKKETSDSEDSQKASLQLVTFDGDLTLYADGQNLEPDSPLLPRILRLLRRGIMVGIVTAAGYDTADRYYERLHGLLCAVRDAADLTAVQKRGLLVVGGEASFVFAYAADAPALLAPVDPALWMPEAMKAWPAADVAALLDLAETTLRACIVRMQLPARVLRKARAVGLVAAETSASPSDRTSSTCPTESPTSSPPYSYSLSREGLEETVLTVQKRLEVSPAGRAGRVPFCAFNGGRDVFVDIGDKSWGVQICQHALGFLGAGAARAPATPATTLHVGDQFLSAGANDFRARRAATTAWVANPTETCNMLDELLEHLG